jgi:hypothetical protein
VTKKKNSIFYIDKNTYNLYEMTLKDRLRPTEVRLKTKLKSVLDGLRSSILQGYGTDNILRFLITMIVLV